MKMISLLCAAAIAISPVIASAQDTVDATAQSTVTVDSVNHAVAQARQQCTTWLAGNKGSMIKQIMSAMKGASFGSSAVSGGYGSYYALIGMTDRLTNTISAASDCRRLLGQQHIKHQVAE